jgi:peptide/nickel transport system substrate-binding protein
VLADYQGRILPAGYEDQAKAPIGTGPFKFVEYVPGDRFLAAKNPDYWEPGLPKVDAVQLRIIPEAASSTASLESGEIHIVADVRAEQIRRLQGSRNGKVDTVASGFWVALVMRNNMPPFNDIRVRKAIAMLIDKPETTNISALGQGTPTHTPIPPLHPYYIADVPIAKPDPDKARALLQEAGHGAGLNLTLWFTNTDSEAERMAVALRDQARKAGVTVELKGVPSDKFYKEVEGKEPFTTTNFFGRPTPDTMLHAWFHSMGSWNQNLWAYKSAEMDQLLDEGRKLKSDDARKEVYQKVQRLLLSDMPSPVIYVKNHSNVLRNNVQGFRSTPRIWLELKEVALTG